MATYALPNRTIREIKRGDRLITKWGGPPRLVEHVEPDRGPYCDIHVWLEDEKQPVIYKKDRTVVRLPTVTIEELAGE